MVKMRLGADYHLLEIVIKATAIILLTIGESNCDSKIDFYDFSISRSKEHSANNYGAHYIPFQYGEPFPYKIQHYTANKDDMSHRITFPEDDIVEVRSEEDMLQNPAKCEGSFYCEDPEYYPTELVKDVILRNGSLRSLAFDDDVIDIAQRIDTADDTPLCRSKPNKIYPKTMEKDGGWHVIVQNEEQNVRQGVLTETCESESTPCNLIDGFASGYETKCNQMYVHRRLLVVTKQKETVTELFPIPSSCCCSVKFVGRGKRSPFLEGPKGTV